MSDEIVRQLGMTSTATGSVVTPAPGVVDIVNVDGTLKSVDSSGTQTALGGGGGASTTWLATAIARAQAVSPTLTAYWKSDLDNTADVAVDARGNNSGSAPTFALSSATLTPAASAAAIMIAPVGAASSTVVNNPQTQPWYLRFRAKTTSTLANNESTYMGLFNGSFLGCGRVWAKSQTFYVATFGTAAIISTVASDTANFHVHEMWFDLTTVTYAIDGVTVGTSTAVAQLPTTPMNITAYCAGNPVQPVNVIDYMFVAYVPPT